jgi:hypothetical protein
MDHFRVTGNAAWSAYRQQQSKAAGASESPSDPDLAKNRNFLFGVDSYGKSWQTAQF